jgi:hypothetical protein
MWTTMANLCWRRLLFLSCLVALSSAQDLTCSAPDNERDPALREMTYDVGLGEQTTWVYVEPDVSFFWVVDRFAVILNTHTDTLPSSLATLQVTTFYKDGAPASTKVVPKHNGFSGKFINLSNKSNTLYW